MVVIKLFYFTNILIGVPLFCFECSQQGHIFREIPPKQSYFFFCFLLFTLQQSEHHCPLSIDKLPLLVIEATVAVPFKLCDGEDWSS